MENYGETFGNSGESTFYGNTRSRRSNDNIRNLNLTSTQQIDAKLAVTNATTELHQNIFKFQSLNRPLDDEKKMRLLKKFFNELNHGEKKKDSISTEDIHIPIINKNFEDIPNPRLQNL